MKADLIALAERVEALAGPCRETDAEIARACGLKHGPDGGWCNSDNGDYWTVAECASAFTASLDAAMTLWPKEVPHLIPSDARICTAMALRARAAMETTDDE